MSRVMIVDDELLIRIGLVGAVDWAARGDQLVGDFSTGEEALTYFQAHGADILVTDLLMPGMSGMALIRRVREIDPTCRVIILSCVEEFDAAQQALDLGVSGYIRKAGFERAQIERALDKAKAELAMMDASRGAARDTTADKEARERAAFLTHCLAADWTEEEFDAQCARRLPGEGDIFVMRIDAGPERIAKAWCGAFASLIQESGRGALFKLEERSFALLRGATPTLLDQLIRQIDFLARMGFNASVTFYIAEEARDRHALARALRELLAAAPRDGEARQMVWLLNEELLERWPTVPPERAPRVLSGDLPREIRFALQHMREHYAQDLSVGTLAELTGLSPNYFSVIFKRAVGQGVVDCLTDIRIENAKRLLRASFQSVREVALRVGFRDYGYFTRMFKRATGMRPSEYRAVSGEESN